MYALFEALSSSTENEEVDRGRSLHTTAISQSESVCPSLESITSTEVSREPAAALLVGENSLEEVALIKDAGDLHENGLGEGSAIQENQAVDAGVGAGLGQLAVLDRERERPDLLHL